MRRTAIRLLPLLLIVALLGGSAPGQAQIWPDVRLVHAASDVGPVDVYVNGLRILNDMASSGHTDYLSAPPGQQTVEVYPGDGGDEPLLTREFPISGRQRYTVVLHRNEETELAMSVWTDRVGQMQNDRARLRVLHLAPEPMAVAVARPDAPALFERVSPGSATGYTPTPAGQVTLHVKNAATGETLLRTERSLAARSAASLALIPHTGTDELTALWLHDAGPKSEAP